MARIELCGVCMQKNSVLTKSLETDAKNVTWHSKLTSCLPDFFWPEECVICNRCQCQLQVICDFRAVCNFSESFRKSFSTIKDENQRFEDVLGLNPQPLDVDVKKEFCEEVKTTDDKINVVQTDQPFTCTVCTKTFKRKAHLKRHELLHFKECKYECELCHKFFRNIKLLRTHKSRKHSETTTDNEDDEELKTSVQHEQSCEICLKTFDLTEHYVDHIVNTHHAEPNKFKPFKCRKCDNRYAQLTSLQTHLKQHPSQCICSYCGKEFKERRKLQIHESIHLNKRSHRCDLCDKGFNTDSNLRMHKLIKHKDPNTWPHRCTICDKRFPIKSNFDNHMRRHLGDKRFECHLCQKTFVAKNDLDRHITSHSNVRSFKCQECEKEYKEAGVLKLHLTKVHGIGNRKVSKPALKHKCGLCPKAFYHRQKLERHLCMHTGERPYGCPFCDKRFADKWYVKQHLKSLHGVHEQGES